MGELGISFSWSLRQGSSIGLVILDKVFIILPSYTIQLKTAYTNIIS
jgi:hypothetical protein